jgi:putative oxidoreductase
MNLAALAPYEAQLRSLARIMVGFTYSQHGWQKFFGIAGGFGGPGKTADPSSLLGIAGIIETFGGAAIILGLFTRPVAFLLSGEMAVGYFRTHAPRGFWPVVNGGELAVFYCFFYLWLCAAGPGPWSLDQLFRKKS